MRQAPAPRSVFFSNVDAQGLQVIHSPVSGAPAEPIGKPLTQIAFLGVAERSGGYVVTASAGSDTYCGSPDQWAVPSPPGAVPGNSVTAGRVGRADLPPRQLEFGGTWFLHPIDPTGSCVLGPSGAQAESARYRIDDLETGSRFELSPSDRAAAWID
jgi:hypothetical protein